MGLLEFLLEVDGLGGLLLVLLELVEELVEEALLDDDALELLRGQLEVFELEDEALDAKWGCGLPSPGDRAR